MELGTLEYILIVYILSFTLEELRQVSETFANRLTWNFTYFLQFMIFFTNLLIGPFPVGFPDSAKMTKLTSKKHLCFYNEAFLL